MDRKTFLFLVLCVSTVICDSSVFDEPADSAGLTGSGQLSLEVEQSFDGGKTFLPRGTLTIHSLRTNSASLDSVFSLNENHIKSLESLCETDGMYMIRLSSSEGPVHRSSIHACNLVESALHDVIIVHLDWRMRVVGISMMSAPEALPTDRSLKSVSGFRSKVLVQQMEAGPQPDTASFIQKLEQDKLAKQRGETKDNRSFLAKYWMYIIPIVLVFAMGSGGGQEGGR